MSHVGTTRDARSGKLKSLAQSYLKSSDLQNGSDIGEVDRSLGVGRCNNINHPDIAIQELVNVRATENANYRVLKLE